MKTKVKTYVLLVGVLIVWGLIAFRISSTINLKLPKANIINSNVAFNPQMNNEKDTFLINSVNRDPFLGKIYRIPNQTTIKRNVTPKKLNWPTVVYNGIISNQGGGDAIFIMSINGQQHLMKTKMMIDSVTLLKGNENKVIVRYKYQNKTIEKL